MWAMAMKEFRQMRRDRRAVTLRDVGHRLDDRDAGRHRFDAGTRHVVERILFG